MIMEIGAEENLTEFFSTYFHEDWDVYGTSWKDVLGHYVSEHSNNDILETANALNHLAMLLPYDADDACELIDNFGNYYYYPNDGLTARQWIRDMAGYLVNESKRIKDL